MNSFIFRGVCTIATCLIFLCKTLAQNYKAETPVPLTPNAASIAKYGDVPIGLNTGQVQISFPIYEINTGSIHLPINLSYNYNGLKVEDYPGWVGTGWVLNATGVITRQKRGLRDEYIYGFNGQHKIGNDIVNFINSGLDPYTINNFNNLYPNYFSLLTGVKNGLYDSEPDMFTFSYPGNSGRFYFDNNQCNSPESGGVSIKEAIVIPYKDIKIRGYFNYLYNVNTLKGQIFKFEIIDGRGNTYTYTIKESSGAATLDGVDDGQPDEQFSNTWLLDRVVDPHGITVNFIYNDQPIALPPTYSEMLIAPREITPIGVKYFQADTQEAVLTGITFQGGSISFVQEDEFRKDWNHYEWSDFQAEGTHVEGLTRPKALSKILIRKGTETFKEFNFQYSYFGNDARLRLDSFTDGTDSGNKLTHEFGYIKGTFPKIGIRENIFKQDLWGYYNNLPGITLLPPINETFPANTSVSGTYIRGGNERKVNSGAASLGLLVSIRYPTGGLTTFEYEPNEYWNWKTSLNTKAGGLRVKKVTTCSEGSSIPCSIKNYGYSDINFPSSSSGRLTSDIVYSYSSTVSGSLLATTYFGSSLVPVVNTSGNVVEYQYITVSEQDGSNGKTIYKFTGQQDAHDEDSANPPFSSFRYPFPPAINLDYRRGFEVSKSIYSNLDVNEFISLSYQTTMEYFPSVTSYALKFGANIQWSQSEWDNPNIITMPMKMTRFIPYSIKSNSVQVAQKIELNRKPDGTPLLTNSQIFEYANQTHRLPTIVKKIGSDNVEISTSLLYPADINNISGLTQDEKDNILSCPDKTVTIEESTSKNGNVIAGRQYIYNNKAELLKVKEYDSGEGFADRVFYSKHDTFGNVLEYVNERGEINSLIYSYDNTLPVAAIINSKHKNFFYDGFEESTGGVYSENARSGKKVLLNNSYTFPQGFVPEDEAKTMMSYWYWNGLEVKWLYSGNLPFARSFSVSGSKIDDVRAFPSASVLTTYTYKPGVGMTSVTDANGLTQVFEYDNLNRLNGKKLNNSIVNQFEYSYKDWPSNSVNFSSSTVSSTQASQTINFNTIPSLPESKYTWNFGNGTIKEVGNTTENAVYTTPGDYVVSLSVINPGFNEGVAAKVITILPKATVSITDTEIARTGTVCTSSGPVTIPFKVEVDGGNFFNYQWQYLPNSPSTWTNIGSNSTTLDFIFSSANKPNVDVRCLVSDLNGNIRYSNSKFISYYCTSGGGTSCPSGQVWSSASQSCVVIGSSCGGGGGCYISSSGNCVCP